MLNTGEVQKNCISCPNEGKDVANLLWAQWHMCVNNLPRFAHDSGAAGIRTRDLLIASPSALYTATSTSDINIEDRLANGTR